MIVALMNVPEGSSPTVVFILEPGNVAKLELGQPIVKDLRDFLPNLSQNVVVMLGYTPDIVWVTEQLAKGGDFAEVMRASMTREPVFSRELDPEVVKLCTTHPKENRIPNQSEENPHGNEKEGS